MTKYAIPPPQAMYECGRSSGDMFLECIYASISEGGKPIKITLQSLFFFKICPPKGGNKGDIADLWNKGDFFK